MFVPHGVYNGTCHGIYYVPYDVIYSNNVCRGISHSTCHGIYAMIYIMVHDVVYNMAGFLLFISGFVEWPTCLSLDLPRLA